MRVDRVLGGDVDKWNDGYLQSRLGINRPCNAIEPRIRVTLPPRNQTAHGAPSKHRQIASSLEPRFTPICVATTRVETG